VPIAVLDWFSLVPQPVFVAAFALAVVGLVGMGAALVVRMLGGRRGAMAALGVVLLLGGLAMFGLDPFPGSVPFLDPWWPQIVTQPQHVASAYWQLAGLGVVLTGFGMLATLLVSAFAGKPGTSYR